jgi:hypothetical protein
VADDGAPGHVGTREAVPGDSSPGDDLASAPSARSRLWPTLSASTRRPERLAALILGLGVLLIAVWEGSLAIQRWLHAQPIHQIPFHQIVLDPPPPAYIKPGASGLLEQVRQSAHYPEIISVLDIDLAELAQSISLHEPWIKSVDRIEIVGYPNQLIVRVTYREPVAKAKLAQAGRVVLDRDGVVLDTTELDSLSAGFLIEISKLDTPEDPLNPKVGVSLGPSGSASESQVAASVKLADFFRRQGQEALGQPRAPILFDLISSPESTDPQDLYTRTSEGLWIHWGHPPGTELPSEHSALVKWSMLTEYLAQPENRKLKNPNDLLIFDRLGARLIRGLPRED